MLTFSQKDNFFFINSNYNSTENGFKIVVIICWYNSHVFLVKTAVPLQKDIFVSLSLYKFIIQESICLGFYWPVDLLLGEPK